MKKLGLLLVFGLVTGSFVYAFDEHQAETKFFEKELRRVKQELKETQQMAQELLMIVIKEKIRSAEEENKRIQDASPVVNEASVMVASEDKLKNNEEIIELEKSNLQAAPSEVNRPRTKIERTKAFIFEHQKAAVLVGVTGAGAAAYAAYKLFTK